MPKDKICALCSRPLGDHISPHHLIPRDCGGTHTPTVPTHRVCHDKVHQTFTNKELAKNYNTIERLLAHEEIQRFVAWIANKEPDFYLPTRQSTERRRTKPHP